MSMVEWKKLQDIAIYRRGSFPQPYGNEEWYDGPDSLPFVQVADVDEGSMKLKYKTHQRISIKAMPKIVFVPQGTVVVTLQGSIGRVAITQYDSYVDRTLGIFEGYKIDINKEYFAFQLANIFAIKRDKAKGSTIKTITKEEFSSFVIPLPSIVEQQRIVGILDTFTSSIENLKEQIAQRRKQYEYYRDQLLTIEEEDVFERLSFGKDFLLKARIGWQGLTKKEYRESGEYKLITGTDFTKYNRIDFDNCVYVEKDRYEQDPYIQVHEDDVLITKDGTLGKIAYIDTMDMPATLNGGVFVVRDNSGRVLQKFLMYYLTSSYFLNWMKHNHTQGSIQHLTQALLSKFTIPVVSKEKQKDIVGILDTFSGSIQNLEAQLALRQKQYEYYRNKLLTFE